MNDDLRLERAATELLETAAPFRAPAGLLADTLASVGRTRQRASWLAYLKEPPMRTPNGVAVGSPTVRLVSIALVTLALVLGLTAAVAGGASLLLKTAEVPPPFGPAANGLVAFERDGDIWVTNAPGETPRLVIGGEANDTFPAFSRDGTRFSFERRVRGEPSRVMVANADGSDVMPIAVSPVDWANFDWSPDGRHLAMLWTLADGPVVSIVSTDGSEPQRELELPGLLPVNYVAWMPPDGDRLLLVAEDPVTGARDVFTLRADGSDLQQVTHAEGCAELCYQSADLSPLGDQLAFWNWETQATGTGAYVHLLDLTTGEDRIPILDRSDGQGVTPRFSPDGEWLLFDGGPRRPEQDVEGATGQLVLAPLDGSAPARPMGPAYVPNLQVSAFSPDGTRVIQDVDGQTWLIDVATGEGAQAPEYLGPTSWQRLVP